MTHFSSKTQGPARARGIAVLLTSLLLASLAPALGCGAAMSTYLILVADAELDGAEAAEAEKYAPYEYTSAKEYLHKAREEQGYADFGAAIEYAFKAQELAEKGKERADRVKAEQQPPPGAPIAPVPTEGEPAPAPASGIIIRKKPEDTAPAPSPTPAPAQPSPELVPPSSTDDDSSSAPESSAPEEVPPALEIIPIQPEQPPGATSSS